MSFRKLFYSLSPKMRLWARRILFWPLELFHREKYPNGLPVPPKSRVFTGGGDFVETGYRFLALFKKHGVLRSTDVVLDIGSGMGRMAMPLTHFLNMEGRYEGIDIMPQAVSWCQENITSRFSNFHFSHFDFSNDLYKHSGKDASAMQLPFDENTFDFVFLISVFTHMLPNEVIQYLKEIYRTLKPSKKCFITCFVYENNVILMENDFHVFHPQDDCHALMSEKVKAANVAFSISFIQRALNQIGFEITHYSKGKWQKNQNAEDFQDVLVITKKSD